jgi:uncharacterized membrane protein
MIEVERDPGSGSHRIVLQPNASMSSRQAVKVVAVLAVAMGAIAVFFAGMGAWLVLPFSGGEWLLLVYCFRVALRGAAIREVITITDSIVCVERGREHPETVRQWRRPWVNVEWVRSVIPGHPSHLYLRLHGERLEVGDFLVESERARLAGDLHKILVDSKS